MYDRDIPRARDMMTTSLVILSPHDMVYDAVKVLLKRKVSGAPVIDTSGFLVGILSGKDCIRAASRAFHDGVPSPRVGDIMTPEPRTVGPNTNAVTIAHLFSTLPFRRLPVVEDGRLLGQISRRDLLAAIVDVLEPAPVPRSKGLYLSALDDVTAEITLG